MKKLLFGFIGQYRNFELTSNNIFDNIIIPNKDTYDIDIVINTDLENNNTPGNNLKYNTYDKTILEEKLYKVFNRYNQLKYIYYFNYNRDLVKPPHELFGLRISQILQNEDANDRKYDYYIFCRMDVNIDTKIIISDYIQNNKLFIISGNFVRSCDTHNRDWDFIWISDYKSLMIFMYPYTHYNSFYKYKNTEFTLIYDDFDKLLNRELLEYEVNLIRKEGTLDGSICNKNNYFKGVYLLLLNDCKFEFSAKYNIFSRIIR